MKVMIPYDAKIVSRLRYMAQMLGITDFNLLANFMIAGTPVTEEFVYNIIDAAYEYPQPYGYYIGDNLTVKMLSLNVRST